MEEERMDYIIRDHDRQKFEEKKKLFSAAAAFLNEKYGAGSITADVKDSYYNMKEIVAEHMELIDLAKAAMEELQITPVIVPIRGGTDGANLSYKGLPCPNICTGGYNAHGKFEFIPVQSLEQVVKILIRVAEKFSAR